MLVQQVIHPGAQGLFQAVAGALQGLAHGGHGGLEGLAPGLQADFQLFDGVQTPGQEIAGELQLLP